MTHAVYGPATPAIRRLFMHFAALTPEDRAHISLAYASQQATAQWRAAEHAVADAITRSGRTDLRDALAGPLLQLVRIDDTASSAAPAPPDDPLDRLDPVSEPMLAALLALLVADLVPPDHVAVLYAPVGLRIDRDTLER